MNNPFGMPMMNNQFGMPMNMTMMNNQFGMPMNMAMMNNMGMAMNIMNQDEDWLIGFKMAQDEINNTGSNDSQDNSPGPKINVIFTTTTGTKRNLVLSESSSIDQAIKKYLQVVGHPELYNTDKVGFLFNAQKLKFGDNTTISNFFKNQFNPKIIVNDTNNLIGA